MEPDPESARDQSEIRAPVAEKVRPLPLGLDVFDFYVDFFGVYGEIVQSCGAKPAF